MASSTGTMMSTVSATGKRPRRRDPTVQVYRGLGGRSATTLITTNNVTFPLTSTQEARMTWVSPDGAFSLDLTSSPTTYLSPTWVGPASSVGTAHAVLLEVGGSPALPVSYTAHDAHAVMLQDNATEVPITFDLASQQLTTSALGGSVTGPSNNRENRVYMRFADNAALLLASEYNPSSANSPISCRTSPARLSRSRRWIKTTGRDQGLTAAFADNVTPGQTGIALSLPSIPVLNAPAAGKANVDGTTQFQWSGSAKVFLFCAFSNDNYDRMCILTSQKEAKLPVSPLSDFTPAANSNYAWAIEVHGDFADVDAASSDAGYLSPYALGEIRGPMRGSGSYAESAHADFTTAP
jgi:hypothetical protein